MNRPSDPTLLLDNPRATLRAWKQYESLVVAAFLTFPKTYVYEPTSLRASTVGSRIRDAIRGALAFDYPIVSSTPIVTSQLAEWWSKVIVKHSATHVFIGTPERVLTELTGTGDAASALSPTFAFETLSFEEITAFTLLISTGRINGPVIITHPPDISLLTERPNVELDLRSDGRLLIL